jgi:aminoglycoside phosphotransferase (APT) family kinase protein
VDFRPVTRPAGSYQEPVTAAEVVAMCRRILGGQLEVRSAVELGWGSYNSTFQVGLAGADAVVLRVAPRPSAQLRSERHWLRSEYTAAAWLVALGDLVPRVLGADFTHQLIGRDYMVQTQLAGVPAPELMPGYPRELWPGFFGQLGALTRTVHEVTGETWGPAAAPLFGSWSEALHASLAERAADLASMSAPSRDVAGLAAVVDRSRADLDAVARPALLHGDLWTSNILLDPAAAEPVVVGVLDSERAWWGDPLADWSLFRADTRPVTAERQAFWTAYGGRPASAEQEWRQLVYRGWQLAAERVEAARHGMADTVARTARDLAKVLSNLG